MFIIEKADYGVKMTFGGSIRADEMKSWFMASQVILKSLPSKFSLLADMRELKSIDEVSHRILQNGQKLFRSAGMERSAVVLASAFENFQYEQYALLTGTIEGERYLYASKTQNWEDVSKEWLLNNMDPNIQE